MVCKNCKKEIPLNEQYYRFGNFPFPFCSTACIIDYLYLENMIKIETNIDGET